MCIYMDSSILKPNYCPTHRYDCDRVPNLPAEQELRDKLINSTTTVLAMAAMGPNNDEILQPVAEISEESLLPGEEKLNNTMHELQRMVDVRLAQSVSQQYSIVLKSASDVRQSEVIVPYCNSGVRSYSCV